MCHLESVHVRICTSMFNRIIYMIVLYTLQHAVRNVPTSDTSHTRMQAESGVLHYPGIVRRNTGMVEA